MSDVVSLLVDGLLGNPFAVTPEVQRKAEAAADEADVARLVLDAHGRGEIELVEKLILAVGHLEARRAPERPRGVLQPRTLPSRLSTRLPRPRVDYVRICMAAGRAWEALCAMRGESGAMQKLRHDVWASCFGRSLFHAFHLERVIRDDDVLILGETGTGKEVVASAVQAATPGGKDGGPAPSASVNAAALPVTLVESELFGFVKGAFTGANESRAGRIRSANGGCFFLDEVGDLPPHTQVKLLRVIEQDEVAPLGADTVHHVDVRFVAATHRDLESMVDGRSPEGRPTEGRLTDGEGAEVRARPAFRRDLFQRLAGNVIRVPPLRDRPEDIEAIGMSFVGRYLEPGVMEGVQQDVRKWLRSPSAQAYRWPGNVRELQNVIRSRLLGLEPPLPGERGPDPAAAGLPPVLRDCAATLGEVEMWYLQRVLVFTEGNLAHAARILGVDRSTVRRRLQKGPA